MKSQGAGDNWRLDGTTIIVSIPMTWKRCGGRKVIIAPDGGDAWAPAKPRPDETLIRALARAHRWKRMLADGRYRSAREIGEEEKVDPSFVNRLLRLTLLAPDIQDAILDGRQPKGVQLEELTRAMPGEWGEQRLRFVSTQGTRKKAIDVPWNLRHAVCRKEPACTSASSRHEPASPSGRSAT